ncbi:FAD binding domain-containing protein [Paracoccus litorisediminis]|uniref:Xanthine dehydrogenase family protein subunit M n=1 Tax=Paracoccus litorisediminis TaxID=2006130 RepID=A0A844HTU8_9RHOB|nr:xanthine dehydrogenase family protein subunit M [Paracoccus litorisediminis]MTH61874.1 xanthine dehydrogenase family protein subunit M [Paracoccus litorisediminis]
MRPFEYRRATKPSDISAADRIIAGGTNILDLMKLEVEVPAQIIDINPLGMTEISEIDGGLRIGAMVRNTDCAADARVRRDYPLLARAILAGASPQLRNRATTGGNLCQRTRCSYFMQPEARCNKRDPGTGCDALHGVNRSHAIFGASENCIATYPGDMAVALLALGASVEILGRTGTRSVPIGDFHRLPEHQPAKDNLLEPGELISSVTLPPAMGGAQIYRKVRDRSSFAFALVSVAAAITIADGRIRHAALAFGSVAHKPWQDPAVETALVGQEPSLKLFAQAADLLVGKAKAQSGNAFKIPLLRRALIAVLSEATNTEA